MRLLLLLFILVYSSLLPSDSINFNEYEVLKKIGQGSYGEVYCIQDRLGFHFALKFYQEYKNLSALKALYTDIEREFELGSKFNHPHIIKSMELIKVPSQKYLVLEFVNGFTIAECPKKFLSKSEAIYASLQLIDALIYALQFDFIYIDLGAANIMLNENKKLKLVDVASFVSFDEIDRHYFKDQLRKPLGSFNSLLVKNFDKLTTMCTYLFDLSTLNTMECIDKKEAIKKLAWNCEEDYFEDKEIHLENYFHQLRELIFSFN